LDGSLAAGLPLRDALGEDLMERVAQEESAFFGPEATRAARMRATAAAHD
jgi:hypothetical protein